ncbi:MAG TPA: hypothetical protein VK154_16945 [Chitinophagales bacterium]|nr:hypothetical protein [Chitinophagales bacterium]
MSGFRQKLIIEFDISYDVTCTLNDVVNSCVLFLKGYFAEMDYKIVFVDVKNEGSGFELLLYEESDAVFPTTSYHLFYELFDSRVKYIEIVDGSNLASNTMNQNDFFKRLVEWLNKGQRIERAMHLGDVVFNGYGQAFANMEAFRGEYALYNYYAGIKP